MDCDLHTHSTASDGTLKPGELALAAAEAGLGALALTDHDTTAGLAECERACLEHGIAFVPGTELSTNPSSALQDTGTPTRPPHATLHILGLFIQPDSQHLTGIFRRMTDARDQRNPRIIDQLNALGLAIDYKEVIELAHRRGSSIVSRPHIAQIMTDKGYTDSVTDAFNRYSLCRS